MTYINSGKMHYTVIHDTKQVGFCENYVAMTNPAGGGWVETILLQR